LLLAAAGCASAGGGGAGSGRGAPGAGEDAFARRIAPFPVAGAAGDPYEHAFLGGFDVPRPQFVDIDGDGDLDLFVQERSDALIFLENTGTPAEAVYVWRTDDWLDLEIGEWSRFADLDRDGDLDLLAEEPYSYMRAYRNVGGSTDPRFELVTDSVRDAAGTPVFADRQNIPAVTDLDCDGRLDLFLGRVDGTIVRYEQVEREADAAFPPFALVTERFENIQIIGALSQQLAPPGIPRPPGPTLHGANTMDWADVDEDGDPDLLWGDFFEPRVLLIENTGTCANASLRAAPRPLAGVDSTSGYNAPVTADIDADGDLDLFVGVIGGAFNPSTTAADNFLFYEATPAGLVLRTPRYLDAVDVGSESVPDLIDTDADGDLDLLVGNKLDPAVLAAGRLYHFRNDGSATSPRWRLRDTLDLGDHYHLAPETGDLDGDGAPDLLLGTWNHGVLRFHLAGGRFTQVGDSALVDLPRGSHTTPALGDLDADGDLDLVVGEAAGSLNLFRNEGSAREPAFTLEAEEWLDIDAGRRAHPALADLDDDGDIDLVVARDSAAALVFVNQGSASQPRFVRRDRQLHLHPLAAPAFGDVDGDGRIDLVSGGLAGGLLLLEGR
ncbi:MAG: FG-GAP repeat domain-containing protein, partial [Longimicrobiales bacterium]